MTKIRNEFPMLEAAIERARRSSVPDVFHALGANGKSARPYDQRVSRAANFVEDMAQTIARDRSIDPGLVLLAILETVFQRAESMDENEETRGKMTLQHFVERIIALDAPGSATFPTTTGDGEPCIVTWSRAEYGSDREGLDLFTVLRTRHQQLPATLGVEVMYNDLDQDALARLASSIQPGKSAQEIERKEQV